MTFLDAIILGIVEGITEFLPVSSTGHLILASHALGLGDSDFIKSFEVIIQLGAISAIIVMYIRSLFKSKHLLLKVLIGFVPIGVLGFILHSFIRTYFLGSDLVVALALFVGGIVLIAFESWKREDGTVTLDTLSYHQAFSIGLAQTIALIPGISRSAATIVAGRSLSLSRAAAVQFSFLLSIPTILAAAGFDLVKSGGSFSGDQFGFLAVGFLVAFVVAWIVSIAFLRFVQRFTLMPFGVYRIVASVILFIILFT